MIPVIRSNPTRRQEGLGSVWLALPFTTKLNLALPRFHAIREVR